MIRRLILPILTCMALSGCDRSKPSTPPPSSSTRAEEQPAPVLFTGSLGERFFHPASITTVHNPHGGASQVDFILTADKTPLGSMFARPLPTPYDETTFVKQGTQYLEQHFHATDVKFAKVTNSHGHEFLTYRGVCENDGKRYQIIEFLFLDKEKSDDLATSMLREKFGAFQFIFVIQQEQADRLTSVLETIMNTFQPNRDGKAGSSLPGKSPSSKAAD